jgi:hypothetical protein
MYNIDRHFAAVANSACPTPTGWMDGWMALFERFDARFLIRLIEAQTIEQSVRMRPTASLRYSNFFSLLYYIAVLPPPLLLTAYHTVAALLSACVCLYNSAIGLKLFLFFERCRRHHRHLIIREKGNSVSI